MVYNTMKVLWRQLTITDCRRNFVLKFTMVLVFNKTVAVLHLLHIIANSSWADKRVMKRREHQTLAFEG